VTSYAAAKCHCLIEHFLIDGQHGGDGKEFA
jgi:hypothetical protein